MKPLALLAPLLLGATGLSAQLPKTLLDFRGARPAPATLHDSVLVVIDAQREYVDGQLPLAGIDAAIAEAAALLQRARAAGTPIVHIVQHSPGALFNTAGAGADVVAPLMPAAGETVIVKTLPNAFAGTTLDLTLRKLGKKNLILVGFMTHMCIASTAHAALDLSYQTTVVGAACATRDLPDGRGGIVPAAEVQRSHLAGLADRFASIVATQNQIQD
jgi:nicotinamidase-related amidase